MMRQNVSCGAMVCLLSVAGSGQVANAAGREDELLQKALDAATWLRLRAVFIVPLFRQYAYKHTRQGIRQPINQQYVAQLREMSKKLGGREKAQGMSRG